MVKAIEEQGIPTAHVCTIVPISQTVGASRIVPAYAIPHPLGNPKVELKDEKVIRRKIIMRALEALKSEVENQKIFDE
jgi:glycine reductase complex component B subunit gamma